MSSFPVIEGKLFVELEHTGWKEYYCAIKDRKFMAMDELATGSSGTMALEVCLRMSFAARVTRNVLQLKLGQGCECKPIALSIAALSRLMKRATLPPSPHFFQLNCKGLSVLMATAEEPARTAWINAFNSVKVMLWDNLPCFVLKFSFC